MKILFYLIPFLLLFSSAKRGVPEALVVAFKERFPEVKKVRWEQKGEWFYEAEFRKDKEEVEVLFTNSGKWLYTSIEIDRRILPVTVLNGFRQSDYRSWKLDEVAIAENENQKDLYVLEAELNKMEFCLLFTKEGKLIEKYLVRAPKPPKS